ncbi:MAG: RNA polymerase subunit sigma-24 [Ruminococcus sp.]|nr:RNA polymerase subunit sigma-24 [Ruminococcus sp.]
MDKTEFTNKLKQYKNTVYRVALIYLRNQADAEDVSQETFLKFYLHNEPFSSEDMEKAWLIRVTLNACHNLHRSVWKKIV